MHLKLSGDELAPLIEMVSLATEMAALNPNDTGKAGYARFERIETKVVLEVAKSTGLPCIIEFDMERGKIASPKNFRKKLTSKNALMRSGIGYFGKRS